MAAKRIIFFDVETRKWAKDLCPEDEKQGWEMLRRGEGGASAICVYDTFTQWSYTYDDLTAQTAAQHIESANVVVGYRSINFDVPVIEGIIGRKLRIPYHYDIYHEMARANAERGLVGAKGDFTLNAVAKRNLGRGKINHGSNAKTLMQQGQWAKLFNYCLDDVHLTHDLFRKICKDGGLNNLNGSFLNLPPIPDWIVAAMVTKE